MDILKRNSIMYEYMIENINSRIYNQVINGTDDTITISFDFKPTDDVMYLVKAELIESGWSIVSFKEQKHSRQQFMLVIEQSKETSTE